MNSHLAAFYVSVAVHVVACIVLLRRGFAWRLGAFTLFLLFATYLNGSLALDRSLAHYNSILRLLPIEAALQIAATLQAFAWFVWSLPKFKRVGAGAFVIFLSMAVLGDWLISPDQWAADPMLAAIVALEVWVGVGVAITLAASLLMAGLIGGTPAAARWHAACLAVLSLGTGFGWLGLSSMTVIWCAILALSVWCAKVKEGPDWVTVEPDPGPYPADELKDGWRNLHRQPSSLPCPPERTHSAQHLSPARELPLGIYFGLRRPARQRRA